MSYIITNQDLLEISKNTMDLSIKIEVLRNTEILGVLTAAILNGSFTIDTNADIRRSCTLELLPDTDSDFSFGPDGLFWLNRLLKIYIGIQNKEHQVIWYSQGCFCIDQAESNYDATSNTLKLNCHDSMLLLNGTKNGNLGASKTVIPAYIENETTGEVVSYTIIRDVVIQILKQLGHIENYMVDDIGEYKAMPDYNRDWLQYREKHPLWNTLPYDLEFQAGDTVSSILMKLKNIYPNYEMFFDPENTFICQRIPSCYEDDIAVPNEVIQNILITEDLSIDFSTVRNLCMVWGNSINADYFSDTAVSYENNLYCVNLEGYEKYRARDTIAITIPAANEDNCFIRVNQLDALPVYDEVSGDFIKKGTLKENTIYVFKLQSKIRDEKETMAACLLGQWQAQALNVLVDGTESKEFYELSTGEKVRKFSETYFKDVYHCGRVSLTVIPNSPFTVQKLGEILDVKSGEEYANIQSDSMALARAEYENWKNCRLTDSITIQTKIIPFLEVNTKCSYRRSDKKMPEEYLIKSLSHSFSEGTTTWNLCKFYPLYQDTLDAIGTHKTLSDYKHGLLGKYTHEQLTQFIPGGLY